MTEARVSVLSNLRKLVCVWRGVYPCDIVAKDKKNVRHKISSRHIVVVIVVVVECRGYFE
jgi:hypothetical protein